MTRTAILRAYASEVLGYDVLSPAEHSIACLATQVVNADDVVSYRSTPFGRDGIDFWGFWRGGILELCLERGQLVNVIVVCGELQAQVGQSSATAKWEVEWRRPQYLLEQVLAEAAVLESRRLNDNSPAA